MKKLRAIAYSAAVAVCLAFTPHILLAEYTIENLIEDTGVREGPAAMRDNDVWDVSRSIVIRDVGLDLPEFNNLNVVIVDSEDEALANAADAGAFIGYCNPELLAAAPHVSWVQIFSAGAERCFPSEKLSNGTATLTNMQKMSSPVIAEHAIAMMLALARKLPEFIDGKAQGDWKRGAPFTDGMTTVAGKTMLVLGLGGIGTEIARRGAALGMRVVATRNSSHEGPDFVDYVGLADEMIELAKEADVIVNALPLTPSTQGLLDEGFFAVAGQKRAAFFINVGRGATVDTDALLAALRSGNLAGAGLDVTDPEPLPAEHPLWREANVIITPHVSAQGSDLLRYRLLVLDNIRRYLAGDALLNVVDPEKGY
jgi:phosphoglycerate dehydrogenase-like enzyme